MRRTLKAISTILVLWATVGSAAEEPSSPELCIRGDRAHKEGDFQSAATYYSQCLDLPDLSKEDKAAAYNNRALSYSYEGAFDKASEDYERAIQLYPEEEKRQRKMAKGALPIAAHMDLLLEFDPSKRFRPHTVPYKAHLGYLFLLQRMNTTEVDALSRVLEEQPNNVDAYLQRAKVHSRNGEWAKAIADLTSAIELVPGDAELYYKRGSAKISSADKQSGIADLERAIQLDPDFLPPYWLLARQHRFAGSYGEAIEVMSTLVSKDPDKRSYREELVDILIEAGQYEQMIAVLQDFIERYPHQADPYRDLGFAYCRTGDASRSIAVYDRARQMKPSITEDQQEILKEEGYYGGPIDGQASPEFEEASRRFIQDGCPL